MDEIEGREDGIGEALGPLRQKAGSGTPWPAAGELMQRAAVRRRRRIVATSGAGCLVLAAVVAVAAVAIPSRQPTRQAGGGGHETTSPGVQVLAGPDGSVHLVVDVEKSAAPSAGTISELARNEDAFSLALTRNALRTAGSGNVLLSPMSADIALAMLELGAAGASEKDIAATLQVPGLPAGDLAKAWSGLISSMERFNSGGELNVADSVWTEQGLRVQAGYLRAAAASFGNSDYQTNFESPEAAAAINAWVSAQTEGRITQLFSPGELPKAADVVIANAVHFHAAWEDPDFAAVTTVTNQPFHTASGTTVSVPTIATEEDQDFPAASTAAYQALEMPYSNGHFAALLVEPKSSTMASFLSSLAAGGLDGVVSSLHSGPLALSMPQLDLSAHESLDEPLSALGLAPLFMNADLSPMLGAEGSNQQLAVVEQAATMQVSQWGTDAAAATGVVGIPSSAMRGGLTLSFDHPYLFLIRDTETGAILFSSVVDNPAAG